MSVKFTVYFDGMDAIKEHMAKTCTKAEHIVAEQVRKDTRPYVPYKNGVLDAGTKVDGNLVIYPGPYARFLYNGKVFVDPQTGSTYAPEGGIKVETDRDLVFSQDGHQMAQSHWFEASKAQNLEKWLRVSKKAVQHEWNK